MNYIIIPPWLMTIRIPINFKLFYENIKQNEEISKFGVKHPFTTLILKDFV